MPDIFRDQPKLRLLIGGAITLFVWGLYLVRIVLDVGPLHDQQGNQAPAVHYLVGALVVTAMIALWIIGRAVFTRNRRQ